MYGTNVEYMYRYANSEKTKSIIYIQTSLNIPNQAS